MNKKQYKKMAVLNKDAVRHVIFGAAITERMWDQIKWEFIRNYPKNHRFCRKIHSMDMKWMNFKSELENLLVSGADDGKYHDEAFDGIHLPLYNQTQMLSDFFNLDTKREDWSRGFKVKLLAELNRRFVKSPRSVPK